MKHTILDYVSPLISLGALIVASLSLIFTLRNVRKNMRLSIQQAVIKIAIEKAKDCNVAWDKSKKFFDDLENQGQMIERRHYDVISEMVISKEIILKSFEVYKKLDGRVIKEKEDYAYIFWKQLNTSIRGFFTSEAVEIAININHKSTYGDQILDVNDFTKMHNENKSTQNRFELLRKLPPENAA